MTVGTIRGLGRWPTATATLLTGLLGCNVYRACTQSITTDEAFTYNLYLAGGVGDIFFHTYDAANHVLHTLLCKASISLFGASELTLRLPSLGGGVLYFAGVFAICHRLFRNSPAMLLSAGLLTTSPGILDYLSVARGYGLALACFTWCIYELWLNYTQAPGRDRIFRAGLVAGLAVAANLVFLFPVSAAGAVVTLLSRFRGGIRYLAPAALIPLTLYARPLRHAHLDNFYYGAMTFWHSILTLVFLCFAHHPPKWPDYGELNAYYSDWQREAVAAGCVGVALIGALIALPGMIRVWANRLDLKAADATDILLLLAYGCLAGSLLAVVLGHTLFGIAYPQDRTGIYLVFLFFLICITLVAKFNRPGWINRTMTAALFSGALFCLLQFAFQFCLTHYAEWPVSAGSKQIAAELTHLHGSRNGVRVGASYELEPDLNFYRHIWKLAWMEPVDRWLLAKPFDYYVLAVEDAELVEKLHLSTRYEEPRAHVLVAERAAGLRTYDFRRENDGDPLTYAAKAETIREKNVF